MMEKALAGLSFRLFSLLFHTYVVQQQKDKKNKEDTTVIPESVRRRDEELASQVDEYNVCVCMHVFMYMCPANSSLRNGVTYMVCVAKYCQMQ